MPSARAATNLSVTTCKGWRAVTIRSGASRSSSAYRVAATPAAGASIATRFMSARSFFDTNVLVYADDKAAPAKQRRALDLVAEHRRAGTGVVSMQVLKEYFINVTRKLQVDILNARGILELLG